MGIRRPFRVLAALIVVTGCGRPPGTSSGGPVDASSFADALGSLGADAAPMPDSMARIPVTLASGQHVPNCLTVDPTSVYWTTSDGKVMEVPISGGEPILLASGQPTPNGIAVDAFSVYWVNATPTSGAVMAIAKEGGTPRILADNQRGPVRIAVANGLLYWANRTAGTVMRMPASGGEPTTLAVRQGTLTAIAVDARTVYWSAIGQGVIRSLSDDGELTTIATGTHATALAVVGTTVYWGDTLLHDDGAAILELDARRREPIELARSPSPMAAVADQHHVYWSDDATGTIRRVAIGGGQVAVIATGQASPSELALDTAHVYWINAVENGSVMRLAK